MIFANMKDEKCWPGNQDYYCKCRSCEEFFAGPKLSPACWKCYSDEGKREWITRVSDRKLK